MISFTENKNEQAYKFEAQISSNDARIEVEATLDRSGDMIISVVMREQSNPTIARLVTIKKIKMNPDPMLE